MNNEMDEGTARMILDVQQGATESEVEAAFNQKIKDEHPDQSDSADASERTKRLIEARNILTTKSTGHSTSNGSQSHQQQTQQTDKSTDSVWEDSETQNQQNTGSTSTTDTNTDSVWEDSKSQTEQNTGSTSTTDTNTDSDWENSKTQSERDTTTQQTATNSARYQEGNTTVHYSKESAHPLRSILAKLSPLPTQKKLILCFSAVHVGSVFLIALPRLYSGEFPLPRFAFTLCAFGLWVGSSGLIGVNIQIRDGWSEGLAFLLIPFASVGFLLGVVDNLTGLTGDITALISTTIPAIIGIGVVVKYIIQD